MIADAQVISFNAGEGLIFLMSEIDICLKFDGDNIHFT
jgi:hypothetical protein